MRRRAWTTTRRRHQSRTRRASSSTRAAFRSRRRSADDRGRGLHQRRQRRPRCHGHGDWPDWCVDDTAIGKSCVGNLMTPTLSSDRGTTLIETMVAIGPPPGHHGRACITLSALSAKYHREPRASRRAHDRIRAGQDGAAAGARIRRRDHRHRRCSRPSTAGGTGLAVGGSSNTAAPVNGYVDWLAARRQAARRRDARRPASWFYERVWQITQPSPSVKQITVTVTVQCASSASAMLAEVDGRGAEGVAVLGDGDTMHAPNPAFR